MKKNILFIGIFILIIIGVVIGITIKPKENNKTSNKNMTTFSKRIKYYAEEKNLNSTIRDRLVKTRINTDKVKIKGIDIDSDNELELLIYAKADKKEAIFILKEDKKHNDLEQSGLIYTAENIKLIYAYSIKDDKNIWYANTDKSYYSIKYGEKNPFEVEEKFNDNNYVISTENFSKYTTYNLNTNKFDTKELVKNSKSNEEIIKSKNLTQEKIKSKAKEK